MKRRNLMLICGAAAASVLAVSATAMASSDWTPAVDAVPAVDAELPEVETAIEIDSETGEVLLDGEVVGTVTDMAGEDACYVVTMEGENGEPITITASSDAMDWSVEGVPADDATAVAVSFAEFDPETGNIVQDGEVIGHAEKLENGETFVTLTGADGEPITMTAPSAVVYEITETDK